MVSIVEKPAVPQIMTAFATFVKVEVVSPVKEIQAIQNIFASMRVDNIKKNYKSESVCRVYQHLEIFRDAIARTGSEKARNLISEC